MPESSQPPTKQCRQKTLGLCARIGLEEAFAANAARTDSLEGLAPYHPYLEKLDNAASYIGRGACAELAPIIIDPTVEVQ